MAEQDTKIKIGSIVDAVVWRKFVEKCRKNNIKITSALEALMTEYIEDRLKLVKEVKVAKK